MGSPVLLARAMGSPPASLPARRRRTRIVVLVVGALLAGTFVWLWLTRPYSIRDLEEMMRRCRQPADLCEFEPGRTITVQGAVTGLRLVNTSVGPYTEVRLDPGGSPIMYRGDVRSRFVTGAPTSIPLTIQTYEYNGVAFRGADEYPYPGIGLGLGSFLSLISRNGGLGIEPAVSGRDEMTVRIASHRGEAFPLSLFRLSLVDVQGPHYLGESGYLGGPIRDEIEGWTPTGNGTSPGGWLSFRDVAGNGLLDIGDEITVRGQRTSASREFDSRMLLVNNGSGILSGFHYWYGTMDGMMYYADAADASPDAQVVWGPVSFDPGPPESVDRFRVIVADRASDPISAWSFLLWDASTIVAEGPLSVGTFLTSGSLVGTFWDLDGDARVSVGDELEIRGGAPRAPYSLALRMGSGQASSLGWRCGHGLVSGLFPLVTFSNETRLNASSVSLDVRVDGGFPIEEARNMTLALSENGTRLLTLDLSVGGSASASGITLTYIAGGDPALLDAGDGVRLDGLRPGARYVVEAVYARVPAVSGTWTVQN